MPGYTTEDIRNIALVGHGGCGKTTLVESLLYHAGAIKHLGRVEDKNTVCDFEAEEQELQHSLNSAIASADSISTCWIRPATLIFLANP